MSKKQCTRRVGNRVTQYPKHKWAIRADWSYDEAGRYSFWCVQCAEWCYIKKTKFWRVRREPLLQRILRRIANPGMWF